MHEHRRDTGLVRAIGPLAFTANIVNGVVGAGIFAVPAALAASAGVYAPTAFLLCAIAMGAIAICFAEGGSRMPTSGGAYGYIEAALGPMAGYVGGTLLWIGDLLACGSVVAAAADVISTVASPHVAGPLHAATIVVVVGTIALVNISGVSRAARVNSVATVLKILTLALFVVAGASAIRGSNLVPTAPPTPEGLGRAVILALFAVSGMETPLSASGEVKDPAKTIPRALLLALGSIAVLYVGVQTIAQGILGAALSSSAAPLADAMSHVSPTLRALMIGGAVFSMLGWVSNDILGTPRMVFAFARDGLLPRALGTLHARTHTPHVAILCYSVAAIALALSGTFAELAVLSTLATAVLYMLGCTAAWRLARRGVALAGAPLNFRGLTLAMAVGVGSMIVLIALASRAEIAGTMALIVASIIVYLVQSWSRVRAVSAEEAEQI
jgi:amino acid transporter